MRLQALRARVSQLSWRLRFALLRKTAEWCGLAEQGVGVSSDGGRQVMVLAASPEICKVFFVSFCETFAAAQLAQRDADSVALLDRVSAASGAPYAAPAVPALLLMGRFNSRGE